MFWATFHALCMGIRGLNAKTAMGFMGSAQIIASSLTWVVNIFYFAAMIPQIIAYYKEKTTGGLSEWMLFLLVNGYAWNTFYVVCNPLPLSYLVMVSLTFLQTLILVFQHFYYDRGRQSSRIVRFYWGSTVLALILVPCAVTNPVLIGNVTGWLNVIVWAVLQVPQIWHLYVRRSVQGFNMLFMCLFAAGEFLEFCCAIILGLPLQTLASSMCALLGYAVLFTLFFQLRQGGQGQKTA